MTEPDAERLKEIFNWNRRDVILQIRFHDSEEFEMTVAGWAQDVGEAPHVHGTIKSVVNSLRNWKEGSDIMFQLLDVERVTDSKTKQIIFQRNR